MGRRRYPRGLVHVEAEDLIRFLEWLAGMEAHSNSEGAPMRPRMTRERALSVGRGGDRVARPREDDQERVTRRIDLTATVSDEHLPQNPMMIREHLHVALPQPLRQ